MSGANRRLFVNVKSICEESENIGAGQGAIEGNNFLFGNGYSGA